MTIPAKHVTLNVEDCYPATFLETPKGMMRICIFCSEEMGDPHEPGCPLSAALAQEPPRHRCPHCWDAFGGCIRCRVSAPELDAAALRVVELVESMFPEWDTRHAEATKEQLRIAVAKYYDARALASPQPSRLYVRDEDKYQPHEYQSPAQGYDCRKCGHGPGAAWHVSGAALDEAEAAPQPSAPSVEPPTVCIGCHRASCHGECMRPVWFHGDKPAAPPQAAQEEK